jgi:hypothetical protein
VSDQIHVSAALSLVPVREEAGWAPEAVWTLWKRKNFLPLSAIEPQLIYCYSPLLAAFVTVYSFFIFMYQLLWLRDISQ